MVFLLGMNSTDKVATNDPETVDQICIKLAAHCLSLVFTLRRIRNLPVQCDVDLLMFRENDGLQTSNHCKQSVVNKH